MLLVPVSFYKKVWYVRRRNVCALYDVMVTSFMTSHARFLAKLQLDDVIMTSS